MHPRTSRRILLLACALSTFGTRPAFAAWSSDSLSGNTVVAATAELQFRPVVASDGAGGMIVAWADQRGAGGTYDVYAQRISAEGAPLWSPNGVVVCDASRDQDQLAIVPDGAGGAIVVWLDGRNNVFPTLQVQLRAQRLDSNGARCWAPDGVLVCNAPGGRSNALAESDGSGGAYVAWLDSRATSDVYAQRVLPNGAVAWTPDGVGVCTASNVQSGLAIATDPQASRLALAWQDLRDGIYHVYFQVLDAAGLASFPANGRLADEFTTATQLAPTVKMRGPDELFLAWAENQNLYGMAIYVPDGTSPTGPNLLVGAPGNQTSPQLVVTSGSEFLVWQDYRSGTTADLYARRLLLMTPQGASGGFPICTATGDQINARIVRSTSGFYNYPDGAVIVWQDHRTGAWDIRAQHVTHGGVLRWTTDGRLVCGASGDQMSPALIASEGGLLAAWQDARANVGDVYAQFVDPNGVMGDTQPHILSITDVPADPGGHVSITWDACDFDSGSEPGVVRYIVQRLVAGSWLAVDTIPAIGAAQYTLDVPTPTDSSALGPAEHTFQVLARTQTGLAGVPVYTWTSAPDSGHSVAGIGDRTLVTGLRLQAIAPNPASSRTRVTFAVPRAGAATFGLFDASGRRCGHWEQGRLEPGLHTRELRLETSEGPIPPGRYHLRLDFDGRRVARSLVIVR